MDEYLSSCFSELYEEDGLLVLAKGLGLNRVISKFIQLYTSTDSSSSSSSSVLHRKLVFCINAKESSELLQMSLLAQGYSPSELPVVITNETLAASRKIMYANGGCFIITSRILIVDILRDNVDPAKICGFLVCNAHDVSEVSVEAFVLNIFRSKNRQGFIKAFSDQPEMLVNEYGKLERVLKTLFVKNLHLYPRFHVTIVHSLEGRTLIPPASSGEEMHAKGPESPADVLVTTPRVTELTLELSQGMKAAQGSILVALEGCLRELRKSLPQVDSTILTLENALFRSFDFNFRAQLEQEWHKISPISKQIYEDIKTLRQLLDNLRSYDSVTFYSGLLALQAASIHQQTPSMWLTTEAAQQLFTTSKGRIYKSLPIAHSSEEPNTLSVIRELQQELSIEQEFASCFEIPPKWIELGNILKEISDNISTKKSSSAPKSIYDLGSNRVIILVKDERTSVQIKEFLTCGAERVVDGRLRLFVAQQCVKIRRRAKTQAKPSSNGALYTIPPASSSRVSDENSRNYKGVGLSRSELNSLSVENKMLLFYEMHLLSNKTVRPSDSSLTILSDDDFAVDEVYVDEEGDLEPSERPSKRSKTDSSEDVDALNESDRTIRAEVLHSSCEIFIMTRYQIQGHFDVFDELLPKYVILYDPDVENIRRIEAYQARRRCMDPDPVDVYFMVFSNSTEETKYINSLSKEKKAFEKLISTKSNMVISLPDYLDEKVTASAIHVTDSRVMKSLAATGALKPVKVVVDIREFRSQLPMLLHTSGLQIIPATITVGDYVLSPDICVERKGISDLFQSFASGRLYNQIENMLRYYQLSCLLIEFSPDKSFCLQSAKDIGADIQVNNVCSKLSLLIIAFPKLRILWSRSPHVTADIFKTLKAGRLDADPDQATAVGNKSYLGTDDEAGDYAGGDSSVEAEAASAAARDMLMSLPGIDTKNYKAVMNRVSSIHELSTLNVHQLAPIIGPSNAKKLVTFFQKRI